MSKAKNEATVESKRSSLERAISAQREKLQKLEEQFREEQRLERERNVKAVFDLIKKEKLDQVNASQWKIALPSIRSALQVKNLPPEKSRPAGSAVK